MNVQLLPAALEDIAVLRAAGYRGTGFLLGTGMGRFVLVERLLPLEIDPRRDRGGACAAAFQRYGERLLGAFFCRRRPRALEWLVGDLVLAVSAGELRAFLCELDARTRKPRLAALAEDEEATWPS